MEDCRSIYYLIVLLIPVFIITIGHIKDKINNLENEIKYLNTKIEKNDELMLKLFDKHRKDTKI